MRAILLALALLGSVASFAPVKVANLEGQPSPVPLPPAGLLLFGVAGLARRATGPRAAS